MSIPERNYLACSKDWKKSWHKCILAGEDYFKDLEIDFTIRGCLSRQNLRRHLEDGKTCRTCKLFGVFWSPRHANEPNINWDVGFNFSLSFLRDLHLTAQLIVGTHVTRTVVRSPRAEI